MLYTYVQKFDNFSPHLNKALADFLHIHMRMGTRCIEPCPYGQAYVRLSIMQDRDILINYGPYNFGGL
jgi:hypothetical protein